MGYKVLYRKYRPDNFDNIVGQDNIINILKSAILNNKVSHAYIFTGPRGTGKTSTAKVFAKAINCLSEKLKPCNECKVCLEENNPDIIEIDAASNNGVDEIRELRQNVKVTPSICNYKVYIIDEVHMLTTEAFNALLKTLEEPPSHVIFILATTDIQKVPLTILSRCQRFDFKRIDANIISKRLKYICEVENILIDEEAINEIAVSSAGGMRDALSILDQLANNDNDKINVDKVDDLVGGVSSVILEKITKAFRNNDYETLKIALDEAENKNIDVKNLIEKLLIFFENKAIDLKIHRDDDFIKYKNVSLELIKCLELLKYNSNPYLLVLLTLVSYIEFVKEKEINVSKKLISKEKSTKNPKNFANNISREIIDIRVNNCFCNANKQFLEDLNSNWIQLMKVFNKNNKRLYSLLEDTKLVLASDDYGVLSCLEDSEAALINDEIKFIEKKYFENFNKEIKFICLTNLNWSFKKDEYINNKKNNIVYSLLEEKKPEIFSSEIENLANELFNDKIVVEK